jgi:3-hydroxybutyryl-CoA dehydrogenase
MTPRFSKIAVIGAGTIGISVATDLLLHGLDTVLIDVSEQKLQHAQTEIRKTIRFAPLLLKTAPKMSEDAVKDKLMLSICLKDAGDCDFIVENVTEDWQIKQKVYKELDKVIGPDICLGMNTSCTSITKTAALLSDPARLIGIHFMNPVFLKSTVEVIRGFHTAENTINKLDILLDQLGKDSIVVHDFPGFVSNRISHLFMNEAIYVVQDQVAGPAEVDAIFKKCYGHTLGPLETADLIGLDTVMHSMDVLFDSFQDSKFRCCPLLRNMVYAGNLGRKTGKGFYQYPNI